MPGRLSLGDLRVNSPISECDKCEENNVKVTLDNLPERVIFRPENLDNNPRADCTIFFPEESSTSNELFRDTDEGSDIEPDYLSIVELKSTYGYSSNVKEQIEGAIDFVIDLLSACDDPPWGIECYCIVPHVSGYKRRSQVRITKSIDGRTRIFNVKPVNNRESLRELVNRNDVPSEYI